MAEPRRAALLRQGYACTGPLLDEADLSRLRSAFWRMVDGAAARACFASRAAYLQRVEQWPDPEAQDPDFRDLLHHDGIHAAAGALLGAARVRVLWQHLVVKAPGRRRHLPWHQDAATWPPGCEGAVAVWIALDAVGAAAGALRYIPGSHLDETGAGVDPVVVPVAAGEGIAHHGRVFHASGPNLTDSWRRACIQVIAPA